MASGYQLFPYPGFGGGLNLRDGLDVVAENQAIDALNVLFNQRGAVGQRGGYAELTAAVNATARYDSLSPFYKADGTKHIVAGFGGNLEALSTAGAVLFTSALPTVFPHYFQRFGGATAEHLYIANGTDVLMRYDGAAFSAPATTGVTSMKPKFLGLSSTDNRLVGACFPGTTAGDNPSTVRFSDEGVPTAWSATNYVDLTPGDGEVIKAVISWRDLVFVFKETKFFVFYGQSLDDDGAPVFNYRPVDSGVGLTASRAVTASEQGVYFLSRNGIYFTSGNQPSRVSDLVEPIFHGGSSVYYTGGELNDGSIAESTMVYHDERLWLSFPSGTASANDKNLVFDPQEKWWSLCNIPAGPMVNFRPGNVEELVFAYSSGENHLGRYVEGAYTADDMEANGTGGTAIASHWQGSWFSYSTQIVKTIRESKIAGNGLARVSFFRDYRQSASWAVDKTFTAPVGTYDSGLLYDDAASLWGPSSIIAPSSIRKAIRGEVFSIKFSNDVIHRSFVVHRLTAHVRETRVPSVVKVA